MGIGYVQIDHRNTCFEHLSRIAKRLGGRRVESVEERRRESWETRVVEGIPDHIPIEVLDRATWRNHGLDVEIAEERLEPCIAAGLIRKQVQRAAVTQRAIL